MTTALIITCILLAISACAIINIYFGYVLPRQASKQIWWSEYLQLRDLINQVSNRNDLEDCIQGFHHFTRDKADLKNPLHRHFTHLLLKEIKKKHRTYRRTPVAA